MVIALTILSVASAHRFLCPRRAGACTVALTARPDAWSSGFVLATVSLAVFCVAAFAWFLGRGRP